MKTYFLLGLAALGLITLAPIESKADDGLYVKPRYQQDRPYYDGDEGYRRPYYDGDEGYRHFRQADEYRLHQWHRSHHRHYYDRDYDPD
jgi:hypothetical protein